MIRNVTHSPSEVVLLCALASLLCGSMNPSRAPELPTQPYRRLLLPPLHFRGDTRAGVQPSRPLEAQALPPDQYILKPAIPPAAHPAFWGPWPPEADLERRARGPQQPLGPACGAARHQEARETPQCQAELGPRSSGTSGRVTVETRTCTSHHQESAQSCSHEKRTSGFI